MPSCYRQILLCCTETKYSCHWMFNNNPFMSDLWFNFLLQCIWQKINVGLNIMMNSMSDSNGYNQNGGHQSYIIHTYLVFQMISPRTYEVRINCICPTMVDTELMKLDETSITKALDGDTKHFLKGYWKLVSKIPVLQ